MCVSDIRALLVCGAMSAVCAVTPGCTSEVEVPELPDLSAIASEYEAPTGSVDAEKPQKLFEEVARRFILLGGGEASSMVAPLLSLAWQQLEAGLLLNRETPAGEATRIDAVVQVDLVCPGAKKEGIANVKTTVADGELANTIWGTARGCLVWQGLPFTLDGNFLLYRYTELGAPPSQAKFLVRLEGKFLTDAKTTDSIDFIIGGNTIQARVPTPRGTVIVSRKGLTLTVRGSNGTFACRLLDGRCSRTGA